MHIHFGFSYIGLLFLLMLFVPNLAFFLLGIYGRNPFMIAAVLILGIGRIGMHLGRLKEIR